MKAPIALFVYNRPEHLKKTLEALEGNVLADESELFIFSDGPKEGADSICLNHISEVRKLIRQKWNFKKVYIAENSKNNGLANSIIAGVTRLVNQYGRVIVLEDDLVTASTFLSYMNKALEFYVSEPKVMQISGYQFSANFPKDTPDTFFLPFTTSWGWATWKRAWDYFDPNASGWERLREDSIMRFKFNLDGAYPYFDMLEAQMTEKSIDSWAIRWWWSVFHNSGLSLFCNRSLVKNIGFDRNSTHTVNEPFRQSDIIEDFLFYSLPGKVEVDFSAYSSIKEFLNTRGFKPVKGESIFKRILMKLFKGKNDISS